MKFVLTKFAGTKFATKKVFNCAFCIQNVPNYKFHHYKLDNHGYGPDVFFTRRIKISDQSIFMLADQWTSD